MSNDARDLLIEIYRVGLLELKKKWGWFVGLGILLVILGTLAVGSAFITTLATVLFIGFADDGRRGGSDHQFVLELRPGWLLYRPVVRALYAVAGFLVMQHPLAASATLTLLIALMLISEASSELCFP
jgi:uncharacterized membrane protein HdeD (DUF308 family)